MDNNLGSRSMIQKKTELHVIIITKCSESGITRNRQYEHEVGGRLFFQ